MKRFLLLGFILSGLLFFNQALAFKATPTHQNLTKKIVEIYNQNYTPKITNEQLQWMLEGAAREDVPPRWINHFYDPIYKNGWTGENESDIPKDTILKLTKIFLSSQDAVSSLNWLRNVELQNKYSLYEGDQTYNKAVRAYAYAKSVETGAIISPPVGMDYKGAFKALGHSLHLLEDLGVPAHVRNDSHADAEPFEEWAGQGSNSDLSSLSVNLSKDKFNCAKIEECFINLAKYTNENFYSRDTIINTKYNLPKLGNKSTQGDSIFYYDQNNKYYIVLQKGEKNIFTIEDDLIHSAYWNLLSKQVVLAGAEALKIFFKDVEAEMVNVQYPRMGTIERTSEQISLGTPQIPGLVSVYGTLAKVGNFAGSVWNGVTSGIGGIFASAKNVLTDAFGINNDFQQIGEVNVGGDNGSGGSNTPDTTNKSNEPSNQPALADIIINEIMYNPEGADAGREWIEIFNNDDDSANLTGWKFFENNTNHNLTVVRGAYILKPFEYAIISNNTDKFLKDYPQYQGTLFKSSFSLSNSGEVLAIKSGDVKVDEVNYKASSGADGNGNSLQLINWAWQESIPTPGKQNKFVKPVLEKTSTEPENSDLPKNDLPEEFVTEEQPTAKANLVFCKFEAVQYPNRSQVIINEVAWMGTINSASDEWIELKNISGQEVDLVGWQLLNKNGAIAINFSDLKNTKVKPGQFLLLERTDDDSAGPKADLIYTGALANSNEGLRLFNKNCGLEDEIFANPNWQAGDNATKKTLERDLSGLGWHTSANVGGTPKKENSPGNVSSASGGGSSGGGSSSVATKNNIPAPQFYEVVINEIMYNPEGADDGREWIEIYNKSEFVVDLTNWKFFEDATNHGLTLIKGSWNLEAGGYAIISNNDIKFLIDFPNFEGALLKSSFSLSNTGESLMIKNQDLQIDEIEYSFDWGANGNGNSLQLIYGGSTSIDWGECAPTPGKENGCAIVNSNQFPIAVFSFLPENPKVSEVINFIAASSSDPDGQIVLYEWDFGDDNFATSTEIIISHIYNEEGEYEIELKVYDNENDFSMATTTIVVMAEEVSAPIEPKRNVVISEIQAGVSGEANNEFVELYNPSEDKVSLAGWALKRKTSQTATSTKNLVSSFEEGIEIAGHGFLLIAHEAYIGAVAPDQRYTNNSNPLAYDDEVVVLENDLGEIVDEVFYQNIESGKSLERKALQDDLCVSAQGDGEYLGNGCDTNGESDFEIREIPNPQNSQSLLEPHKAPLTPENFTINYQPNEMSLILSWDEAVGSGNLSYKISDISSSTPLFSEINTNSTLYKISINGINRDYKFSVKTVDELGFESEVVEGNIFVPSFLSEVAFYQTQEATSTPENFVNLKWVTYPFIPMKLKNFVSGQESALDWYFVFFYLNVDAPITGHLLYWSTINDYQGWGASFPNQMKVVYPNRTGRDLTRPSLGLSATESMINGPGGNALIFLRWDIVQSGNVLMPVAEEYQLTSGEDFITLAFYAYQPGYEPNNRGLGLIAIDKQKYYLEAR